MIGKKNTTLIEGNNSNIRHFLAGRTRRTKVVSGYIEMLGLTLRICRNINEDNMFSYFKINFYLSLVNSPYKFNTSE